MAKNFINIETGEILDLCVVPRIDDGKKKSDNYLKRKRNNWVNRLALEKQHRTAWFVTLTYDERRYDGECHPEHIQKFMKRVRRFMNYHMINTCDGFPLKYFFTFERGEEHNRGHWHGIIYGLSNILRYKFCNGSFGKNIWNNGFVTCKPLNGNRVWYVTKYMLKQWDDVIYPYLFSRGIGDVIKEKCCRPLVDFFRRNMAFEWHDGCRVPFRLPKQYKDYVFQVKHMNYRMRLVRIGYFNSTKLPFDDVQYHYNIYQKINDCRHANDYAMIENHKYYPMVCGKDENGVLIYDAPYQVYERGSDFNGKFEMDCDAYEEILRLRNKEWYKQQNYECIR